MHEKVSAHELIHPVGDCKMWRNMIPMPVSKAFDEIVYVNFQGLINCYYQNEYNLCVCVNLQGLLNNYCYKMDNNYVWN